MKNRGDDATENVNFQRGKQHLQGRKNFKLNFDEFFDERQGDDATENVNFQSGKQRLQGAKISS